MSKKSSIPISKIVSNNWFVLKLLFGATPLYGISIIVEAIRHNLINFLEQTICIFYILRAIEQKSSYSVVVKVVVLFLAVDFVAAAISNLYNHCIHLKYLPIAQQKLKSKLYQKAKKVDISCYDDPVYYNNFVMAVSEANKSIERAEQLTRMIFGSITLLCCYGIFFLTQDVTSIIFVVVSFLLRTLLSNMLNKLNYTVRLEENKLQRKREYIQRIFYLKDYAKELRINKSVTKNLHDEFDAINEDIYHLHSKVGPKRFLLDFSAKYIATDFMLDIIYVVYLLIRSVVFHSISMSTIVVLYNSAAGLRRGLSTVVDLGPFAVETSLYISKIKEFLNQESKIKENIKYRIPEEPCELECRDVSFGYNEDHMILKHINIKIKPKQKIALVGYNGAGKTTLIKLLLRFYDPLEGRILLNGHDIREYSLLEYRNYIGVVFQDFQIFAANLGENVMMDVYNNSYEAKIMKSIDQSGLLPRFQKLPHGLETQITKEFYKEGTEFSGGEGQKIAVSRAFYKDGSLVFMDEPSSALDPIAEYQLNTVINEVAKDRTVVFISHRLSTTKNADYIYMLEDGQIIEEGTHAELLKIDGKYGEMWNVQANRYVGQNCVTT